MHNYSTEYPAQVDTTDPTGFPTGAPRNDAVAGDGTGTPLERKWVSDVWGFFQALLSWASITANGTGERVGASQLLSAVRILQTKSEVLTTSGTWAKPTGPYTRLRVRCVAGGAAGGDASAPNTTGGGGASGEDRTVEIAWVDVPSSVAFVVGAGASAIGTVGGNTNFGSILSVESLGFGGSGAATQLYGGGGGGRNNGGNGVSGGGAGGTPALTYDRVQPRGGDATGDPNGGYSHARGWGGGGRGGSGGNHGGAGAPGLVSNGGGGGGASSGGFFGGRGGGIGGGVGSGMRGAGYGGGGGGGSAGVAGAGGGGGGGGAVDIPGAPASTQSPLGQPGVIVLTYW